MVAGWSRDGSFDENNGYCYLTVIRAVFTITMGATFFFSCIYIWGMFLSSVREPKEVEIGRMDSVTKGENLERETGHTIKTYDCLYMYQWCVYNVYILSFFLSLYSYIRKKTQTYAHYDNWLLYSPRYTCI